MLSAMIAGQVFSIPYEPMRKPLEKFTFSIGMADIVWRIEQSID